MRSPDRDVAAGVPLLELARASIEHGLAAGGALPVDLGTLPGPLLRPAATFVTLRLDEELRGCCGNLEAVRPLAEDVAHSAFRAAFRDPRFEAVTAGELAAIRLEIAVLSPLRRMTVADEADLLAQLVPGTDGLVIEEGSRRATFLPKVWESLPEPARFLRELKRKSGLPEKYWSERLAFLRYRTTCYAEPA